MTWPGNILKYSDGAKYEGEWKDNRANGNGKFWHVDGDTCRYFTIYRRGRMER